MIIITLSTDDFSNVLGAGDWNALGHVLTLFGQKSHLVGVVKRGNLIHRGVVVVGRSRAVMMMVDVTKTEQR